MMIRTFSKIMIMMMLVGSLFAYSGGSGTESAPYIIATTDNLIELSNTSADWGAYFIQTADIAFNADETQVDWNNNGSSGPAEGFAPIGTHTTAFTGKYDGDGYTIDNLYMNHSAGNIALFGYTDGATITNIGATNVNITGNSDVGGLVGDNNNSTVSNSYSTGNVSGSGNAGGLVGYNNNSTVSNSYSTCSVSIDSDYDLDQYAGGLVGYNISSSTISNSYSTGSVSGNSEVGGLVGANWSATISNSYSTGNVSGNSNVGGLVGDNDHTVSNCFWDTQTSGQASSDGGTGKTTAQMKDIATFTDVSTDGLSSAWDFETNPNDDTGDNDYWDMDNSQSINNGYPFLSWENGTEVALPVTLASFSAEDLNGAVKMSWTTESETENLAFRIYRNEEQIAELEGAGTTSEPQDYKLTDNHVIPGKTYTYVLADVTIGNKEVKHSDKAVTITVGEGNIAEDYSIGSSYPNPFNPDCMIPLNLAVSAEVNAVLYDLNGRIIRELHNGALTAGSHDLKIDGANLSTGIYLVKIRINNVLHVQKIALMK